MQGQIFAQVNYLMHGENLEIATERHMSMNFLGLCKNVVRIHNSVGSRRMGTERIVMKVLKLMVCSSGNIDIKC